MVGMESTMSVQSNGKMELATEEFDPTAVVSEPVPPVVVSDGEVGNGELGGEKKREIVLGRNVHTTCLAITEPDEDDESTGDKDAYMASVLARYRKNLTERTKYHLGYPYNLEFDYGALGQLQHFSINNLGDPFIESNYGVHSRQFEVGVLDWFARLWEIEKNEYWGYITNCGTEGNLHGILVGREVFPDGILYASRESHYSVFKAARMYRMECVKVGTLVTGEIDCGDFKSHLLANKDKPAIINVNIGTTVKGAVDDLDLVYSFLPNPFGELGVDLSDSELRETAYEIFVGACRSSGGSRPLTYVSSSERKAERLPSMSSAPSLQRSLTSTAASKVKKALGLKSLNNSGVSQENSVSSGVGKVKRAVTVGELMRVQMRISDQIDSRVRRALLRIAAGQLGRRIESLVLPLELLQQFKSSDFPTQREYEAWQKRNLKVLEAGLLRHPHLPLEKTDTASQQLRQIVRGALDRPIDTGKHSEAMQALRNIVILLACRSFDGSISEICHWADGVPLNLRLYQILLEACFDVNEATSVIEEVDEVIELIKKTWVILGINQALHNLCFLWILFHRYVATGEVENDLLFAADNLLLEVENDGKATKDPAYSKILCSTLNSILGWAEKKLSVYHGTFYRDNIDVMQSFLSLSVTTAKILVEDISHEYYSKRKEVNIARGRVNTYIRSSVRNAFSQEREKIYLSRRSGRCQKNPLPVLSVLAQDISDLAFNEKEIYSPILKRWHPLATGVAVATLHACYGNELKQFVSGNSELTPDSIQVLIAADKLEKDLVQMAVEDSVDSEDGGKSIIQEMTPYEAEGVITNLVKSWIRTRIDRLKECIDRNLQQEVWNPQANKELFAPSAVEVLQIVDGTLEAFFLLPIPRHHLLLPDLMSGLDRCLQHYIFNAKSGCGSRSDFIPTMPALTRCTAGSKLPGVFKKKDKLVQRRKPQVGITNGDNYSGIPQLCVRINTLHHIRKGLEALEKKTITQLRSTGSTHLDNVIGKNFELSRTTCLEGVQQLCMATAYKVIFHDLYHVLWDGLYLGEVSSFRIEPFLQELEQYLEIISSTVHDRVRTRLIADVMKASFEGFLLVLLAGGPSRAFTVQDSAMIEEDFKFLADLFWSGGDGLPVDLIDGFAITVKHILPLFHTSTENLIEQLKCSILEEYGSSAKSRLPLPQTSGQWNPTEPDTILRVLCYRNDRLATNFLKKTYNLPKKL